MRGERRRQKNREMGRGQMNKSGDLMKMGIAESERTFQEEEREKLKSDFDWARYLQRAALNEARFHFGDKETGQLGKIPPPPSLHEAKEGSGMLMEFG
jgi:hypothetical protein